MPEKTKLTEEPAKSAEENAEECVEKEAKSGNWSEDRREKGYYYDDAYGYEVYNPDEDEDDDAENC